MVVAKSPKFSRITTLSMIWSKQSRFNKAHSIKTLVRLYINTKEIKNHQQIRNGRRKCKFFGPFPTQCRKRGISVTTRGGAAQRRRESAGNVRSTAACLAGCSNSRSFPRGRRRGKEKKREGIGGARWSQRNSSLRIYVYIYIRI